MDGDGGTNGRSVLFKPRKTADLWITYLVTELLCIRFICMKNEPNLIKDQTVLRCKQSQVMGIENWY